VERASVRVIHSVRSVRVVTASASIGFVKLGHPVPLSNLSREEKRGGPGTPPTKMPSSWLSQ